MSQQKKTKRIRQFAGLLALLLAFGVLALIAILQSDRGRLFGPDIPTAPTAIAAVTATAQAAENPPMTPLFEGWSWPDVTAVRIQDPDTEQTRTLRQNADATWTLLEDESTFDQETARRIAQTVAIMPVVATLPDVNPADYGRYGLTSDTLYMLVQVVLQNGDEHAVAIGDITPRQDSHYALIDEDETVYVVDARPVAYLAQQWRDNLLFGAPSPTPTE